MKQYAKDFRVREGEDVNLKKWPTVVQPYYDSKKHYKKILRQRVEKLSDLQSILYAADSYALLIIFQAMDAAGKDSAIKHVMSGVNPQGCQVFSFKHPSLTRNWTMISYGGRINVCPSAAASAFSIVRIMKRC